MPLVEAYYLLLHPYTESKCRIFWDYQVWYCFLHCIVMNLREQEEDQSLRNKRGNFTVKERSRSQCTSVFENVQKMYLVLRPHSSLTAILCKINHYPKHKYTWRNRLSLVKMYSFQREYGQKRTKQMKRLTLCIIESLMLSSKTSSLIILRFTCVGSCRNRQYVLFTQTVHVSLNKWSRWSKQWTRAVITTAFPTRTARLPCGQYHNCVLPTLSQTSGARWEVCGVVNIVQK